MSSPDPRTGAGQAEVSPSSEPLTPTTWENLVVLVPAWNEEESLPLVVPEIKAAVPGATILVVNDGSTDRTVETARACGVDVLDLPLNLGVGGAMRAGYRFALRKGYSYAAQLDADGQHDPSDLPKMLTYMLNEQADLVIGARFAGTGEYKARGPRRWAMRFLASVLSRVTRTRLTDATSGLKLCNGNAIRTFAQNYPAEYLGDTVEALVIAARAGLRVRQLGVEMRPRAGGTPSHSPLKATVFLVRAILALFVALTRPKATSKDETP